MLASGGEPQDGVNHDRRVAVPVRALVAHGDVAEGPDVVLDPRGGGVGESRTQRRPGSSCPRP
jgi:hypothetical protein